MGNFFGLNDSWTKIKKEMTFLSREQVLSLFEKAFDIIVFKEFEKDGKQDLEK